MNISFDPIKRARTLEERGLDFADAGQLFAAAHLTLEDDRRDYPEQRFQTYGLIDGRLVMLAWTPTPNGIRVISMRKCNEREQRAFNNRLG